MPDLTPVEKQKITDSRIVIDAYRAAHTQLYSMGWHKGIPEEHTPLLNIMVADLKTQGFNSIDEFFDASKLLNLQELGLEGKELTEADKEALEGNWH